jgi:hypothetical protein
MLQVGRRGTTYDPERTVNPINLCVVLQTLEFAQGPGNYIIIIYGMCLMSVFWPVVFPPFFFLQKTNCCLV